MSSVVRTPPPTVKGKYTLWYNYRWNHEDWYADWHSVAFVKEMQNVGLKVNGRTGRGGIAAGGGYTAIKVLLAD